MRQESYCTIIEQVHYTDCTALKECHNDVMLFY